MIIFILILVWYIIGGTVLYNIKPLKEWIDADKTYIFQPLIILSWPLWVWLYYKR